MRDELACVIIEPIAGNMNFVRTSVPFMTRLRELCYRHGALLIMDEVLTGFRVTRSGWYGREGISGDLMTFGKVMGGGLPAAAFGGRAEIMDLVAPAGPVYQAGTLSGNPLAVAAALATLNRLDDAAYEQLGSTTDALASGLRSAAADAGAEVAVQSVPGLVTTFFSGGRPVTSYEEAKACDLDAYGAFCRALLERGVYPPASQFEAWFPSLAHTGEDVERTVRAAREAFAR